MIRNFVCGKANGSKSAEEEKRRTHTQNNKQTQGYVFDVIPAELIGRIESSMSSASNSADDKVVDSSGRARSRVRCVGCESFAVCDAEEELKLCGLSSCVRGRDMQKDGKRGKAIEAAEAEIDGTGFNIEDLQRTIDNAIDTTVFTPAPSTLASLTRPVRNRRFRAGSISRRGRRRSRAFNVYGAPPGLGNSYPNMSPGWFKANEGDDDENDNDNDEGVEGAEEEEKKPAVAAAAAGEEADGDDGARRRRLVPGDPRAATMSDQERKFLFTCFNDDDKEDEKEAEKPARTITTLERGKWLDLAANPAVKDTYLVPEIASAKEARSQWSARLRKGVFSLSRPEPRVATAREAFTGKPYSYSDNGGSYEAEDAEGLKRSPRARARRIELQEVVAFVEQEDLGARAAIEQSKLAAGRPGAESSKNTGVRTVKRTRHFSHVMVADGDVLSLSSLVQVPTAKFAARAVADILVAAKGLNDERRRERDRSSSASALQLDNNVDEAVLEMSSRANVVDVVRDVTVDPEAALTIVSAAAIRRARATEEVRKWEKENNRGTRASDSLSFDGARRRRKNSGQASIGPLHEGDPREKDKSNRSAWLPWLFPPRNNNNNNNNGRGGNNRSDRRHSSWFWGGNGGSRTLNLAEAPVAAAESIEDGAMGTDESKEVLETDADAVSLSSGGSRLFGERRLTLLGGIVALLGLVGVSAAVALTVAVDAALLVAVGGTAIALATVAIIIRGTAQVGFGLSFSLSLYFSFCPFFLRVSHLTPFHFHRPLTSSSEMSRMRRALRWVPSSSPAPLPRRCRQPSG